MADNTVAETSDRRRKGRLRMLDRKLARAVVLGAMDQDEADFRREEAGAMEWIAIFDLIMMIIEMIREWMDSR